MKTIAVLAFKNANPGSITDSVYFFEKANDYLIKNGEPAMFRVNVIGFTNEVKLNGGRYVIKTDTTFDKAGYPDLIIIPSLTGHATSATYLNKDCSIWIAGAYKNGSEVASLCTGAFLLAFSGILEGKECTTHWEYANEFRYFYPSVNLVDERIVTDQEGLYSSGGNNAYWNLLLHLMEKYTSRALVIKLAKFFVIDIDKSNQSVFIVFQGLKDHEDKIILKSQEFIEKNFSNKLSVDEIAEKFHLTKRTFERRFKNATRNTVAEYIQKVKIEAAKKQLEIGRKSINEVMYNVGYSDVQAFREVFKKITGMTPFDYKNKYKR
ncbi:AraC family transcriptional regulator [Niastella vici]|uniref:AraC family transcriptional regulator n=1 Tax=Niastella vici TaxID=1703345 RepID=A0A1V9G0U6_9BACT|nr:helix-turn-helix domain-containing protein [Niastella vici]OQP64255.1 AraC family transcriptional regulator [Niastella vici]